MLPRRRSALKVDTKTIAAPTAAGCATIHVTISNAEQANRLQCGISCHIGVTILGLFVWNANARAIY
jgi:hypothetical protein